MYESYQAQALVLSISYDLAVECEMPYFFHMLLTLCI